jgi:hypothetical protein
MFFTVEKWSGGSKLGTSEILQSKVGVKQGW